MIDSLKELGIFNLGENLEHLDDWKVVNLFPSLEARCSSDKCLDYNHKHENAYVVKHGVKKTAHFCPDCGHALLWVKK